MTDYVKSTNFTSKDSLATGNPLKIVKGAEFDVEFNAIATAVATKADIASPTLTGTPAAPTAATGTNSTQIATTAFVKNAVDAYDAVVTISTAQIEDSAVTTAKIADANVTEAKLASNSVTQAKMVDASVGTAELIDANVTPAKLSQPFTLETAKATTSGTAIDFTSIPSWVKRITVVLNGVSASGTSHFLLKIGDGAIVSAGYTSYAAAAIGGTLSQGFSATDGFILPYGGGTSASYGSIVLNNIGFNVWVATVVAGHFSGSSAVGISGGGTVTLVGTLDRLRLTSVNGTDTFDAGSVNILYE